MASKRKNRKKNNAARQPGGRATAAVPEAERIQEEQTLEASVPDSAGVPQTAQAAAEKVSFHPAAAETDGMRSEQSASVPAAAEKGQTVLEKSASQTDAQTNQPRPETEDAPEKTVLEAGRQAETVSAGAEKTDVSAQSSGEGTSSAQSGRAADGNRIPTDPRLSAPAKGALERQQASARAGKEAQNPAGKAMQESRANTPEERSAETLRETPQSLSAEASNRTPQELSAGASDTTLQGLSAGASDATSPQELSAEVPAGTPQPPSADEAEDFALPEEPDSLPFELPAVPKQLSGKSTADSGKTKKKRKKKRRRRKRHILFWVFVFLTLCVAGGSVSYIYWLFTEAHSVIFDMKADVELPNLVGLRWEDVEKDEAYSGFTLQMVEVYHDEAPVGQIVDQNPRAPRDVKEDSVITAKVSKGVETVIVPDLTGWNKDTAREKLRGMNLTLMIRPEDNTEVPSDSVIHTSPEAGTLVKAGTTITLYIRRESTEVEYVSVPTCIGAESSRQAEIRLTQRSLTMRVTSQENDAPEGTVIAQSPNPGVMVPRGSEVNLVISTGPPPPPPPPVEVLPEEPDSSSDANSGSGELPPQGDGSSGTVTPPDSTVTPPPDSTATPPPDSTVTPPPDATTPAPPSDVVQDPSTVPSDPNAAPPI